MCLTLTLLLGHEKSDLLRSISRTKKINYRRVPGLVGFQNVLDLFFI